MSSNFLALNPVRLFLCLCLLSFLACQNEQSGTDNTASDTRHQQSFFIRYLADVKQIKAQAEIWENTPDGKVYQRPPGGVAFQGSATQMRSLPGERIRYEQNRTIPYGEGKFRFSYRDQEGNHYERTAELVALDSFTILPKTGDELFRLEAHGPALAKGEQLTIFFSDAQNKAATKTFEGPRSEKVYTITREDFRNAASGPGFIYLVKKKKTTDPKTGTRWSIEYYTPDQELALE